MDDWNTVRSKSMAIKRFGERAAEREQVAVDRREQALLDEVGRMQFVPRT